VRLGACRRRAAQRASAGGRRAHHKITPVRSIRIAALRVTRHWFISNEASYACFPCDLKLLREQQKPATDKQTPLRNDKPVYISTANVVASIVPVAMAKDGWREGRVYGTRSRKTGGIPSGAGAAYNHRNLLPCTSCMCIRPLKLRLYHCGEETGLYAILY